MEKKTAEDMVRVQDTVFNSTERRTTVIQVDKKNVSYNATVKKKIEENGY